MQQQNLNNPANCAQADARKQLTALRRKRATSVSQASCIRCGGAGGYKEWPGYTCYRCGGERSMTHEKITTRFYPNGEDAARDAFLQSIIDADAEKQMQKVAAARMLEQLEKDHSAALQEDAKRTEKGKIPHIGEVGGRVTYAGKVVFAKVVESQFGSSMLIVVCDDATGAVVKTFSSSQEAWVIEAGMDISATATVKHHEVREGVKTTVVTRAKMVAN